MCPALLQMIAMRALVTKLPLRQHNDQVGANALAQQPRACKTYCPRRTPGVTFWPKSVSKSNIRRLHAIAPRAVATTISPPSTAVPDVVGATWRKELRRRVCESLPEGSQCERMIFARRADIYGIWRAANPKWNGRSGPISSRVQLPVYYRHQRPGLRFTFGASSLVNGQPRFIISEYERTVTFSNQSFETVYLPLKSRCSSCACVRSKEARKGISNPKQTLGGPALNLSASSPQDTRSGALTVFAPTIDPAMVVWHGAIPSLEEIAELYGADECLPSTFTTLHQPYATCSIHLKHAASSMCISC
eukprot:1177514-Prorocentrum_minimum.AAC.2